ncbi:MAG: glycosyltransferase family 4 protein [Acidobacteria bacterium]|nr:glycosyltransferase family 4 protein [Acidobacteriota bacterium]MBS1866146.1 glycosyltransferase family 4 protein [Acidobacteriota bacterium]
MRVAIVSPFVDKKHGTERAVAELAEHLAFKPGHEVHVYSQRVDDVAFSNPESIGERAGDIHWRKVVSVPGPHIVQFLSWFRLNRSARQADAARTGKKFDIVFSVGINCPDADVILVHAVFQRLAELQKQSGDRGLRSLHRKLYYGLLCKLERKIYSDKRVTLAAVSQRTADQLARYFGRNDVRVIPNGVDFETFNPAARISLRRASREHFGFSHSEFVVLLVGNDWRNKGLGTLLESAADCRELPLRLLVVGSDDPENWRAQVSQLGLEQKVRFAPPSPNVLELYAAADVLAAPSREDSFNLPVLEAMACGLAAITSTDAGVATLLHHGTDCFILEQATDSATLAVYLRQLYENENLRTTMGEQAVRTASAYSWGKSCSSMEKLMEELKCAKYNLRAQRPQL